MKSKKNSFSLTKFRRERCVKIVDKLISLGISTPFHDIIGEENRDYHEIIKKPMALNEVRRKLVSNEYSDFEQFTSDLDLIWDNARLYNGDDSIYSYMANAAQHYLKGKLENFPLTEEEEWLMKVQKITSKYTYAIAHPPVDFQIRKDPQSGQPTEAEEQV